MRLLVMAPCLLLASTVTAQSIAIANSSFEAQALSAGSFFYSPTQITDWSSTATGGADRGVWNTTAPGKDGLNIAFAYRNNAIAQQLTHALQPDTVYTFDYLMGRTGNSTRGTAELWAGGTLTNGVVTGGVLLASVTNNVSTSSMLPFSLTYTSPSSGSEIGELLTVRFVGTTVQGESYVSFDHARLTAVPEPASIVVLALGIAALARRRIR